MTDDSNKDDDDYDHDARVVAWMERAAGNDAPPELVVHAFEDAFGALWRRSHLTLGDVTLTAIVDRVLYDATERFSLLSSVEVKNNGLRCEELRRRAATLPRAELSQAIRFVLGEFLTVLGNLTAEILSPALHAELSKVGPEAAPAALDGPAAPPPGVRRNDGEGAGR